MKECCVFSIADPKEAFRSADFEKLETLNCYGGEDCYGDDFSNSNSIVRCRRCGAILLQSTYNSYSSVPIGDSFYTVYYSAESIEDARAMKFGNPFEPDLPGRRYIQEIYREFGGDEYHSGLVPEKA